MRRFQRTAVSSVLALLALAAPALPGASVRVTTWNLKWFPHGSSTEIPSPDQAKRIAAAADVLRPLNSDVILLQEVQDYHACARLAEAIRPQTYQVAICSAFKEPFTSGLGKQQVAILAKEPAQAAWAERWKSMEGIDPPRGFAFAWFKIGGSDVGVYSLHLKSNLIMRGDRVAEAHKNIRKREVAADQLLNHIRDVIAPAMPMVKSFVVGGDFNTNPDQPEFAEEKTLSKLTAAGFRDPMEGLPLLQRITHPGSGRYPDATFDYLFGSNMIPTKAHITPSRASDHYPVTCDYALQTTHAEAPRILHPTPPPSRSLAQDGDPEARASPQTTTAPATSSTPEFVTITRPVRIKIPYGETVLPRGLKLTVLSRSVQTVTVQHLDGTHVIPISSTDLH